MTTQTSAPLPPGPHVDAAVATLRGELARADNKAALLLALTGAGLAALVSLGSSATLPASAMATGAVGATALLAATVILLLAVRPQAIGPQAPGWPSWPSKSADEVLSQLLVGHHLAEVQMLAASARTKFARIRLAVDLVLAGLGFLAVTAVLAAAL